MGTLLTGMLTIPATATTQDMQTLPFIPDRVRCRRAAPRAHTTIMVIGSRVRTATPTNSSMLPRSRTTIQIGSRTRRRSKTTIRIDSNTRSPSRTTILISLKSTIDRASWATCPVANGTAKLQGLGGPADRGLPHGAGRVNGFGFDATRRLAPADGHESLVGQDYIPGFGVTSKRPVPRHAASTAAKNRSPALGAPPSVPVLRHGFFGLRLPFTSERPRPVVV